MQLCFQTVARSIFLIKWGWRFDNCEKYSSPYNFTDNALLEIVNDGPFINEISSDEYALYLTDAIYQLAKSTPGKILVLFNSLATIKDVFNRIQKTDLGRRRQILAQGVNGTKSKLTREFMSSSTGILFGAASFWEGMDLSNGQLDLDHNEITI